MHLEGLEDEDSLAEVPARVCGDERHGVLGNREALVLRDEVEHRLHLFPACAVSTGSKPREQGGGEIGTHLLGAGRGDAHEKTTRADGGDELAGAVRTEDEAHVGHVLLHRAAERGLGVACERVGFMDDNDYMRRGTLHEHRPGGREEGGAYP